MSRRRPLRSGRLLTGGLLLGAVGAALAPAGPDALVPFKILAASAASDVYVAVVIDFGPNSNLATISKCVPVPSGSTDADALAAAVGESNVAYSSSGLLCSIDGYPVDGVQNCNNSAGPGSFYFWSYWHGATGAWTYADDGPAEHGASDGDVEGWRFQNPGPASPAAPQPGLTPNYTAICGVHVPAPTTTTTTATAAGPTPTTAVTTTSSGTPVTTGTIGTTPKKGASSTAGAAGSTTTTTATAGKTAPSTTTTSSTSPGGSTKKPSHHGHLTAAAASSSADHRASGAPWLPIIIVTAIVAALALVAFFRLRRRPAEE